MRTDFDNLQDGDRVTTRTPDTIRALLAERDSLAAGRWYMLSNDGMATLCASEVDALTKTAQVRLCGNSVCPPIARALVAANFAEAASERKVA